MSCVRHSAWSILIALMSVVVARSQGSVLPRPDHVIVVILENHGFAQIAGAAAAPYLNALMADSMGATFTRSYAIGHPSQPNYIRLFSGSGQGVTHDSIPPDMPFRTPNLAASLIVAGRTFITYSEDLPHAGFDGAASGAYARKHNPAMNWVGTDTNQIPASVSQPWTSFPKPAQYDSLPTIAFVVPNQDNDMHNGKDPFRIERADLWVGEHLDSYVQWCRTHNSLLIVTFDEDDGSVDNNILTFFFGPMVRHGMYADSISHYSVLRMLEEFYGLPYAGRTATVVQVPDCWLHPAGVASARTADVRLFPQPASDRLRITLAGDPGDAIDAEVLSPLGECVVTAHGSPPELTLRLDGCPAGMYAVRLTGRAGVIVSRTFVVLR